jgi:ABC-2 type transport system ATP-binding protein
MTGNVLEVTHLQARYGTHEVLSGVSLSIPRGEWFCLLGPNGVGKSTLLHCITGRISPVAGNISICGESLLTHPVQAKRKLGAACAPEQLPGLLTGRQCLEVYALAKELASIDADVLDLAGALKFTKYLDQFVDTYSLGTRQKLCVLLALLGNPTLIVLDEAFNGLDPASAVILKQHLQQRLAGMQCAVLLATHSLDIVERHADKAALLLDGRIAREWNEAQMLSLRQQGADAFESALAAAAVASS